ncbi:PLD nuclease N-terminal domain-containing protein [Nonomuraea pusilla]|uniref:Phospholipase_D-nuclease N-terminal n=1 Tax=Nonomuraea pusilla TaxID=46177 RepID=A0A1H8H6D8_9ACTN|nr:PLD nuclease N-terminal domain-containing protein [Nonomuraea pusilla]SEN51337.1 Phospholipase_D-nuclease N-terminal [Nonomuraea pusilla]
MRWDEMPRGRRAALLALASVEVALTATAAADLWFRPRESVRGRKALWAAGILVQPVGPLAYLLWGRRGSGARCRGRAGDEGPAAEGTSALTTPPA